MKKLMLALLCMLVPIFHVLAERPVHSDIPEQEQWITLGADAIDRIRSEFSKRNWPVYAEPHITNPDVYLMQVNEQQMIFISRLMHHLYNRCGGFIAHEDYNAAIESAIPELNTYEQKALSYTLNRGTEVNTVVPTLTEAGIRDTITSLSNFTTRYYTSQSSVDAANWLKNKWQTLAAGRSDISVQLYSHSWLMPSVVMTITGAHQPQDIVVLGGHLDSINQSGSVAPGADDDASGIATLTEIVRAVLAKNYVPSRTIKIIGYAAEEVGLRGSSDIAAAHKAANANVIGVLQLDMTNYKGSASDIYLMTDYTNAAQNTFVNTLIDTYTGGATRATGTCGYACSDHASWHNQGYAASMPFESAINASNPRIHTANDTLANMGGNANHALKFAKMGAAYMIEMGKGGLNGNPGTDPGPVGGTTPPPSTEIFNNTNVTGIGSSAGTGKSYYITVPSGATNLVIKTTGGTGDADMYVKFNSASTTSSFDFKSDSGTSTETVTIASPSAGRYYILLQAYSTFSSVTLNGSYSTGGGGCSPVSWTKTNLSAAANAWVHNTIVIPACSGTLTTNMSGGTGDGDMYVRYNAQPTTSTYNCRPYKSGNTESCTITNPTAGTWYVSIRAYSAFSGVTQSASFQ